MDLFLSYCAPIFHFLPVNNLWVSINAVVSDFLKCLVVSFFFLISSFFLKFVIRNTVFSVLFAYKR